MKAPLDVAAHLKQLKDEREAAQAVALGLSENTSTLRVDAGNLSVFDGAAVDLKKFRAARDTYLHEGTRRAVQVLFREVFTLPVTVSNDAVMASLPPCSTVVPREKPFPTAPEQTTWEKFAAKKGIQKKKRDRMVYDEETQEYRARYGKDSVKGNEKDTWLLEHKQADEKYGDPFLRLRREKQERVAKQQKNERKNLRKASNAAEKKRDGGKSIRPGSIQERLTIHSSNTRPIREDVQRAVKNAQLSSASMGVHDKLRSGESSRDRGRRRKLPASNPGARSERSSSVGVLNSMFGRPETKDVLNVTKATGKSMRAKQDAIQSHRDAGFSKSYKKKHR